MEPDGIHASDTLLNFDSVSHLQLTSNDGFRFGRYGKVIPWPLNFHDNDHSVLILYCSVFVICSFTIFHKIVAY